jgi:glycosyltransferase involved in cell wall biosynthesis
MGRGGFEETAWLWYGKAVGIRCACSDRTGNGFSHGLQNISGRAHDGRPLGAGEAMNIAIIGSRGYPVVYSGYETFVKELAERLVARGVGVTVYCHRNLFHQRPRWINGIRLVYIRTIETKTLSQFVHSLQSMLHACFCRHDVILVVNSANGPFGILTRLFRKRSIINVDGLEWLRPKWKGLGARYFYWASRMATKFYDRVVTDSAAMQQIYMDEFAAASLLIAYGANFPPPLPAQRLAQWGLQPGGYYLVVGRLVPDNNGGLIVREFSAAKSDKKLVVVGDVPYADPYAAKLKSQANGRLVFPGVVTDGDELSTLFQHCYVYLHGHEFGGTNPTLLQALASGCAVCALDTAFNRETLLDGEYGFYFTKETGALAGLIAEMEEQPDRLLRLREKSRKRIQENYTWEKIVDQYGALFAEVSGGGAD